MGPWTTVQISHARSVPFRGLLDYVGAYYKVDREYKPADVNRQSVRVHVNYQNRDFRFILTNEKWVNELLPISNTSRGGGGAIDFGKHIVGCEFVEAVSICLKVKPLVGGK